MERWRLRVNFKFIQYLDYFTCEALLYASNDSTHQSPFVCFAFSAVLEPEMLANSIVDLLIQDSRVAQIHRASCDIGPAEWLALRFFARANPPSRKASALADFEASSRAAVSPIIGRLESKGYVRRQQSQDDGRSFNIEVTAAGHAALQNDPIGSLVQAVRKLPEEDQVMLQTALRKVLANLAMSGVRPRVDICRDCRHLIGPSVAEGSRFDFRCDLLNVAVDQDALAQLCVCFEPVAPKP